MSEGSFESVIATWGYPGDMLTKSVAQDIASQSVGMVVDNKVNTMPGKWRIVRTGIEDHGDGTGRVIAYCESPDKPEDLEEMDITDMIIGVQVDAQQQQQPAAQSPEPYPNEASIREATRILAAAHSHSFTYQLNANHTALRGCSCGLSFVGHMVGVQPGELRWHRVKEENEE